MNTDPLSEAASPELQGRSIDVSLVIPLLNEEDSLRPLTEKIRSTMAEENLSYEIVFIDDGSTDGSIGVLEDLHSTYPEVKIIQFRRNFGKSAAYTAGFRKVKGRWVVLDLGSTNGTWVNGKRVRESKPLWTTDRVRFGRTGPLVEVREQLGPEATAGFGQEVAADTELEIQPVQDDEAFVVRKADALRSEIPVQEQGAPEGPGHRVTEEVLSQDANDVWAQDRAGALRSILDRERDQLFLTRRLLRDSKSAEKNRHRMFIFLLLSLVGLSYAAFQMKLEATDSVDKLIESCRDPGVDSAAAQRCQELLTRLFDEVAAACAGGGSAERMLEARCEQVEHMAYRVASERAEAYRSQFRQAVLDAEARLPGFEMALSGVLSKLGSPTVQVDSLPPAFVETVEQLIEELREKADLKDVHEIVRDELDDDE